MADSGNVEINVKTTADKASAEAAGSEISGTLSDATLAGLGGIDEKLAAIESGKGAIKVVADLKKGLAGLGDKKSADALNGIIDAFAKTMKGDIGTEEVAKLKGQIEALDKVLKNLKSPWLEKIGPKIQKAQAAMDGFVKTVGKLPEKTKYAFDFKGLLQEAGLHTTTLSDNISALITKLPGVGSIGAIAFGVLGLAVAAVTKSVSFALDKFRDLTEKEEEMRVKAHVDTASTIQKEYDSRINGIALETKKREGLIEKMKMQADASRALKKAQDDLADAQSRFGVRDAATLDDLEITKSERDAGREYDERKAGLKDEEDRLDAEREKLEEMNANMSRRSERLRKENRAIAKDAAAYYSIANAGANMDGVIAGLWGEASQAVKAFVGAGITKESAQAKYDELQQLQNEGREKIASDTKEMALNQQRLKEIEEERNNIKARRDIVEAEKRIKDQERENLKEQKEYERKMAARQRVWTLDDRTREDDDLAYEMRMRTANRIGVQGGQEYLAQEKLGTLQNRLGEDRSALEDFWADVELRTGRKRTDNDIAYYMTDDERERMARLEARVREGQRNVAGAEADLADVKFAREQREGEFRESVSKQSNRLTAMGLGSGDGSSDFERDTAQNTKELVSLTREMLKQSNGRDARFGDARRLGAATWAMT